MTSESGSCGRLRLLILTSTYPRWHGDPEPGFVHELARRLVDTFDVTVIGPHARGAARRETLDGVRIERYRYAPDFMELLVNDGGIMTNLRRRRWMWLLVPGFLAAQAWTLWRVLRQTKPDVVHAHWVIPQGLIVALLRSAGFKVPPFLVTAHGADIHALRSKPLRRLQRLVLKQATAATAVSGALCEELRRIDPDLRTVVEPMGVDTTSRFTPSTCVHRSRDEILFVGRLVEKKGVRFLIDALRSVLVSHPQARLTIVGFGPEEASIRAQVRSLGLERQVELLGAVPQKDLPQLYRRAAVFVAPFVRAASGDQEGLGLVAVEAAACGCPLVLSALPGVADVLEVAHNVRTVQPGSAGDLACAICGALDYALKSDEPTASELERLRARFDWSSVATRYAQILIEVAASTNRGAR